jgi:hypothetical protein
MRPTAPTYAWLVCCVFGIATLAYSLILQSIFPASGANLPPGYGTPVIAFEFAREQGDLIAIFGDAADPAQGERLVAMQSGNEQDFLFMFFYAVFLASGCWALWRELRRPLLLLGVVMPVMAALFDAWENMLLFAIQVAFSLGEFAPEIESLAAPVIVKFLLLTATNIVIGFALAQIPGRGWQLAGTLVIVPCVATIMALIAPAAFGWTLAAVIAAGWIALLLTATWASWQLLRRQRALVNFTADAMPVPRRRRSDSVDAGAEQEDPGSPMRPAVFGRRRTDQSEEGDA